MPVRALCLLLVLAGCSRDLDGTEIARVLARNGAGLAIAIDQDRRCGFESPTAEVRVEGEVGQLGSATWTINDCDLQFDRERTSSCDTTRRALAGRVRLSGIRTIVGTVTGDPEAPVLPDGPDATSLSVVAELDGFVGEGSSDIVSLPSASGTLEIEAKMRRATGQGGGCTVSSPNVALTRIHYAGQIDVIDGIETTAHVDEAALSAVRGQMADAENVISGSIVVDGLSTSLRSIPLDQPYYQAAFIEAAACQDNVALPVSYECGAPSPAAATRLAAGAVDVLALIARAARTDKRCGFAVAQPVVQVDSSTASSELKRVSACRIDFGSSTKIEDHCGHGQTIVSGVVTVTGTMRTVGLSTNGSAISVLPADDGALSLEFEEVLLDGFEVVKGESRYSAHGVMTGRVEPRLARSTESGNCTLATPISFLSGVRLENLTAMIDGPGHHAQGVFSTSSLVATIGTWGGSENEIAGTAVLSDASYEISGPIDPNYDRSTFDDSWQCGEAASTKRFQCDADAVMGAEIARHSVLGFQKLAELMEADETCGFSNSTVRADTQILGTIGSSDGQGITMITGCELAFEAPTPVSEDCFGNRTWIEGRAVISGTKIVDGWVTGDPTEPMLSTKRDGVRYELLIDADNLRLHSDDSAVDLTVRRGLLAGAYTPRVAIDADNGACTKLTPEARVETLALVNADVEVQLGMRSVTDSALYATIGRLGEGEENRLGGRINLNGTDVPLPTQPLSPEFDARAFVTAFSCSHGMHIPVDDRDCDMKKVLGEVGARLLVQSMGSVTQVAGRDDFGCAFGSRGTLTDPSEVVGDLGQFGHVVWSEPNCRLAFPNNQQGEPFDTSCEGDDVYFDGAATYDADRRMEGIRDETSGADYIHPETPDATRIDYRSVIFEEFSGYRFAAGESGPEHQMWIHSGSMSGVVEPFMAAGDGSHDAFDEGDYTVPSPIVRFNNLAAQNVEATISYDGKRFRVRIATSSIDAFSGSWEGAVGETNSISGAIVIDGTTIELTRGGDLNPDYDQAEFDESYACANRLLEPISPE